MIVLLALALTSADCASCHAAQAKAFEASRHAVASALAVYRASAMAAKEKTAWCAGCHRPAGPRNAAVGLECTTCHGVSGEVADAGHTVAVTTRACASCHEFATPKPGHFDPVVYSTQPLQATAMELSAHDAKARCTSCHDPHRPTGAHDVAQLRAAVTFAARRVDAGVEIAVSVKGTGHRFPTGDPFRRLVISVCADAVCNEVVGRAQIARGFALRSGVWAPVIDHSLADGETRTLRFADGVYWRAALFYGDPRFERVLPAEEVSVVLGSGAL